MDDNKTLQTESVSSFFVILADRDGVRKYVSKSFPKTFPYTIKLNKAQRFLTEEQAIVFVKEFKDYGKYRVENPNIRKVYNQLKLA